MEENISKSKVKSKKTKTAKSNEEIEHGRNKAQHTYVEHVVPSGNGGAPYEIHHHYYYEPPRPKPSRSSKPGIAGALLILTTIFGLIATFFMVGAGIFMGNADESFEFWGADNSGDVAGTVEYLNGTPAENVTISVMGEDIVTQTDDGGNYILFNVPTGNQKIQVEKEGYNTIIYKKFVGTEDFQWNGNSGSGHNSDGNNQDFTITPGDRTLDRGSYPPWGMISGFLLFCAILIFIFSIISLFGAYHSFKRKKFSVAIAGAIVGIFTVIGIIFSLIALFILIISRNEFSKSEEQ